MPRGELKHRYWFFADTPNIGRNFCVIWKDLWWLADRYRRLKYRGGFTIPLLQISVWGENCVVAWHYADIGIQLLFANNRNRVRGAVLGLSQDGTWTDLFENLSVNSLKGGLSNDTTFKPPLFSLVSTFNTTSKKNKLFLKGNKKINMQWYSCHTLTSEQEQEQQYVQAARKTEQNCIQWIIVQRTSYPQSLRKAVVRLPRVKQRKDWYQWRHRGDPPSVQAHRSIIRKNSGNGSTWIHFKRIWTQH